MENKEPDFVSHVPWSTEPSLKALTEEVGIDFNHFIDLLKNNKSDQEIAQEFKISEKTIINLRDQFMTKGVGSIMGGD